LGITGEVSSREDIRDPLPITERFNRKKNCVPDS